MKKLLLLGLIFFLIFFGWSITLAQEQQDNTSAQDVTTSSGVTVLTIPGEKDKFVPDKKVRMAGNLASRSSHLLNWILDQYQWSNISQTQTNSFAQVWIFVRNITYALLVLLVLVAAFLLIISRGQSLAVKKFVPKFVLAIFLVTLSFSIIQFIYQVSDIVQGFLLKKPDNTFISDADLFRVGFDYGGNFGYRKAGIEFDESVWVTLWLTKLTALTYFAMFLSLLVRKIILWLFLIASPLFAILIVFPQLQSSTKFWLGQFTRWLLYGPLFATFLVGLVSIWNVGIPLNFDAAKSTQSIYPTATDLVLLAPGQPSPNDNLNTPSNVIRYITALVMLWAVILLPFFLLKVASEYFISYSITENNLIKYLVQASSPVLQRYKATFGSASSSQRG